jgi:plasmid stabilization system protein ParE
MMSRSPAHRLILTRTASDAIIEQASYYTSRESQALADRWEAAVRGALARLPSVAALGPRCNFKHPELKNVRRIPVPGFPRHLIFYQDLPDQALIRVVLVVHGARDIEAVLSAREPM